MTSLMPLRLAKETRTSQVMGSIEGLAKWVSECVGGGLVPGVKQSLCMKKIR